MTPHFLSAYEVVIAIDPRGYAIIGCTHEKRGLQAYEIRRLRWDSGAQCFYLSSKHPKVKSAKVGDFYPPEFFEGYDWWEGRDAEPVAVNVSHRTIMLSIYISALKKLVQLSTKSEGDDQLLALEIGAEGLRVRSLGDAALTATFESAGKAVPDTGLGQAVVCVHALKRVLKDARALATFSIEYTGPHRDRALAIGPHLLWTVNRHAHATEFNTSARVSYPIASAIRRALKFASQEANRSNLTQLHVEPNGSGVRITSTDGSVLYRETVDCDQPPRTFLLPTMLARKLPKRSTYVSLAFDDEGVSIELSDALVVRATSAHTFPPGGKVLATLKHDDVCTLDLAGRAQLRAAVQRICDGVPATRTPEGVETVAAIEPTDHVNVLLRATSVEVWRKHETAPPSTFYAHVRSDWVLFNAEASEPRRAPGMHERVTFVAADRLALALDVLEGELTISRGPDTSDPLAFRTDTQQHLLMPMNR